MADRRVNVKLTADAGQYMSTLAKAGEATAALDKKVADAQLRVDKARRAEESAIERVALAKMRLDEVSKKEKVTAVQLEAATQAVARAQRTLADRTAESARAMKNLDAAMAQARDSSKTLGTAFAEAGDDAGQSWAQRVASQIKRRIMYESPLIAGVVAGALTAGAPVALAGAAMLFGGIAGVAGAQATEVRSAWRGLGEEIARGSVQDAAVVIPALTGMADDLGDAFQGIRPQLRDAFEETAPLVEMFTSALTGLVEEAMPGLVRAVTDAEPVMEGFDDFLRSTGGGLGEMFDRMAEHAPAAGEAFGAWGELIEALLPLIGELMGQGAELATIILPPLTAGFTALTDVVELLGPLLPAVVGGFMGLKVARTVATGVGALGDALAKTGDFGVRAGGGLSSAAGWLGKLGGAAAIVTGALVVTTNAAGESERQLDEWARQAVQGSEQSSAAFAAAHEEAGGWLGGITDWVNDLVGVESSYLEFGHDAVENLKDRTAEVRAEMSDTELAQLRVASAQDKVAEAVDRYGAESPEAIRAVKEYEAAQSDLETQEGETELAIAGVTGAMIDQAEQAMAAIDSQFAYRNSVNDLEDAQEALEEAVRNLTSADEESKTTQEEVERASLLLEEQVYATAQAYGQQQADLSGLSEESSEYKRLIQTEMLAELYRLRDAAGPEMKAAIQTQIDALLLSGVKMDETGGKADAAKGRMNGFRDSINGIPAYKQTVIDANVGPATTQIDKLMARLRSEGVLTVERAATGQNIFRQLGGAIGGIVHAYKDGGFEPMRGGIAQVVAPNTWRVIGDRVVDDEAYIPINSSQRSQQILEQTAGRMGYDLTPQQLKYFKTGGIATDRFYMPLKMTDGAMSNAERTMSGPGGGGALMGGSTMVAKLYNTIRAAFPRAKMNSGYRAGDPGYHGQARAIDLGEAGFSGGIGRAYLGQMAAWIYRNYGAASKELIYTGAYDTTPDLKNGRPLNYGAATNSAHKNHVHWAMANGGVIDEPVIGRGMWSGGSYSFGERGSETVIPGIRGREWGGSGGGNSASMDIDYKRLAAAIREATPPSLTFQNVDPASMIRAVHSYEQRRAALASPW